MFKRLTGFYFQLMRKLFSQKYARKLQISLEKNKNKFDLLVYLKYFWNKEASNIVAKHPFFFSQQKYETKVIFQSLQKQGLKLQQRVHHPAFFM